MNYRKSIKKKRQEKIKRLDQYQETKQKAQQKAVILGQGMGKLIAVDAELSAGEQIVIRGGDTLTQGDKVKVLTDKEFPVKT